MTMIEQLLVTLQRESDFLLALATVDAEGLPRVRTMKGIIDEQLIIRYPTFASTEKVCQIHHCADVSLTCGDTDSSRQGRTSRSQQEPQSANPMMIGWLHGRRTWRSGSAGLMMPTMLWLGFNRSSSACSPLAAAQRATSGQLTKTPLKGLDHMDIFRFKGKQLGEGCLCPDKSTTRVEANG